MALAASLALAAPLAGCSLFGGGDGEQTYTYITSQTIEVVPGAQTKLCNDSLTMTVTGIQKRPVSTFANANVEYDNAGNEGANEMSSTSVIIEVDMALTFNENTYMQVTQAVGGKPKAPSSVADIFAPGELMFVRGKDPNGGDYQSYAVVMPETQTAPSQAISNSQWHYDLLDQQLPEASETITGSMLFKVSAKAHDLQLIVYTADNNAEPLDGESVRLGNNKTLILDLDGGLAGEGQG